MRIVFLVASSVENLQPENITVIDSQGTYDVDPCRSTSSGADAALRQLEVKRHFEIELERRVQSMVEFWTRQSPGFGDGRDGF